LAAGTASLRRGQTVPAGPLPERAGDLPELLARASAATALPLIAYPNRGVGWDAGSRTWLSPEGASFDPGVVAGWASLGAAWLGGCCGVGPADIQGLAEALRAA
jgi:homocysteine S-methyltransferase